MSDKTRFEDLRSCVDKQKYFGKDGLYFCGFWISPEGQIHEISLDAQKISKDIAQKEKLVKNKIDLLKASYTIFYFIASFITIQFFHGSFTK